jgi:hypothetical protein
MAGNSPMKLRIVYVDHIGSTLTTVEFRVCFWGHKINSKCKVLELKVAHDFKFAKLCIKLVTMPALLENRIIFMRLRLRVKNLDAAPAAAASVRHLLAYSIVQILSVLFPELPFSHS